MQTSVTKARRESKPARGTIRRRTWTTAAGTAGEAWQADFGTVNGKRLMKSFDTKAAALTWLNAQANLMTEQGHAAWTLTDAQRTDAVKALAALRDVAGLPADSPLEAVARLYATCAAMLTPRGRTLLEAAEFMARHATDPARACTIAEAAAAFEQDARDNNLRPASIESIARRLRKLTVCYGARQVAEFTRDDAAAWLRDISPKSRPHFRVIAHGLFNFCIDRGSYVATNPFAANRLRRGLKRDEALPECMGWRTVETILRAAAEHEPSMVAALAVGFFTGLRTAELRGLEWAAIDMDARRITVMPAVAKKRRARYVAIEDNLFAWLSAHRRDAGPLAPTGEKWRSRLDTIREKAGAAWPHNAMRHSFASHHLMRYGDAAKTALQLGHHRDTSMLFEHYRALVTPEDAAAYFNIRPVLPADGVIAFGGERAAATA